LQIEGYPGYGASRKVDSFAGEVRLDGAKLQYKAFQVFGLGTPSICELYFVLENNRVSYMKFSTQISIMYTVVYTLYR